MGQKFGWEGHGPERAQTLIAVDFHLPWAVGIRSERGECFLAGPSGRARVRTPLVPCGCFLGTKAEIMNPWLTLQVSLEGLELPYCVWICLFVPLLADSFFFFQIERFFNFYRASQFSKVSHTISHNHIITLFFPYPLPSSPVTPILFSMSVNLLLFCFIH